MTYDVTDTSEAASLRALPELELSVDVLAGLVEAAPDGIVMTDGSGRIVVVNQRIEQLFGFGRDQLLGQKIEVLLPEEDRQAHRAHRVRYGASPSVRPMGTELELRGRRCDGTTFPVDVSLSPHLIGTGPPHVIASVRDVTDRREQERRDRVIRNGLDAVEDGVFMFDVQSLRFGYVNEGAVRQVGYPAEELLTMTTMHLVPGLSEVALRALIAPLLDGRAASVHDTMVHRRSDGTDVPVEVVLQVPERLGGDDRRTCVAVARDIRDRIEQDRRLDQSRSLTSVFAERERLARELHDTVIQELFATGMQLQAVQGLIDDQRAADRVSDAIDALDGTIAEIRGTIFGLTRHPRWGDGLQGRVLEAAAAAVEALGFEPEMVFVGPVESLPDAIVEHVVPVVREGLSNVARHANASTASVTVEVTDGHASVSILDDGSGISGEDPDEHHGYGVRNMLERARSLGGACGLSARDGGGTTLSWRVPVTSSPET